VNWLLTVNFAPGGLGGDGGAGGPGGVGVGWGLGVGGLGVGGTGGEGVDDAAPDTSPFNALLLPLLDFK